MSETQLSREQAASILKLDLANIIKKAKANKPLSREERSVVEKYAMTEALTEEPMSMEQIAGHLGCTRQTLYDLKKRFPHDVPVGKKAKYLSNWKSCVGKFRSSNPVEDDNTKQGLECKRLRLTIEQIQLKLDREKGLLISSDDFSATIISLCTKAKNLLRWYLETKLPARLEGLSAGEIRELCKSACDDICNVLSNPDFENITSYESESTETLE